jgi:hypothetical protein
VATFVESADTPCLYRVLTKRLAIKTQHFNSGQLHPHPATFTNTPDITILLGFDRRKRVELESTPCFKQPSRYHQRIRRYNRFSGISANFLFLVIVPDPVIVFSPFGKRFFLGFWFMRLDRFHGFRLGWILRWVEGEFSDWERKANIEIVTGQIHYARAKLVFTKNKDECRDNLSMACTYFDML